jgi:hypothetical protein
VTGLPVRFYWALPLRGAPFFRKLAGDGRVNALCQVYARRAFPVEELFVHRLE